MFSKYNPIKLIGILTENDLLLPALLLVVYITFLIIARGVIPTSEELIETFANLYSRYGYEIIFTAAFLESLVLVNLFVPGQLAMALGVIFARTGQTDLHLVVLTASLGAISGYTLDYILGYYGFSTVLDRLGYGSFLDQAKRQVKRFGKRGLVMGFIHSNIASFLSLTVGTLKMPWTTFLLLAVLSTFVWSTAWALLVYSLGDIFLHLIKRYSFLLVLLVIGVLILSRSLKKEE